MSYSYLCFQKFLRIIFACEVPGSPDTEDILIVYFLSRLTMSMTPSNPLLVPSSNVIKMPVFHGPQSWRERPLTCWGCSCACLICRGCQINVYTF